MKKAIIIGASTGIGAALAKDLAASGIKVGITGRRVKLLGEISTLAPDSFQVQELDIADVSRGPEKLQKLWDKMNGADLIVLSAGTGDINNALDFAIERETINTNVTGFTWIADWAYKTFAAQGHGHLAAITSIAALQGNRQAPAYNASKAYQVNYLEGLRQKASRDKVNIVITDIRPGFVDTAMAKGEGRFWVMPVEKVVQQIYTAIRRKRSVVYVTRRWIFVAFLLRLLPKSLLMKL